MTDMISRNVCACDSASRSLALTVIAFVLSSSESMIGFTSAKRSLRCSPAIVARFSVVHHCWNAAA